MAKMYFAQREREIYKENFACQSMNQRSSDVYFALKKRPRTKVRGPNLYVRLGLVIDATDDFASSINDVAVCIYGSDYNACAVHDLAIGPDSEATQ